jgi:hypothetical protein
MLIDRERILREGPLELAAACKVAGVGAFSTVWRWAKQGVRQPNGDRLFLVVAEVAGIWATSRPALKEFMEARDAAARESRGRKGALAVA